MQQQMPTPPGNQYEDLREFLTVDFDVESATLDAGGIPGDAGVLLVVDPDNLGEEALFAADQYLMRGGTLVVAAGAFDVTSTGQSLMASRKTTGLDEWLAHHGVTVEGSLVMDPNNAAFPVPVRRQVGGFSFQDLVMLDYPYFVDVRGDGLDPDFPATADLPQVTVAWASPVDVDAERNAERTVRTLLRSSPGSWRSSSTEVMPRVGETGVSPFEPEGEVGANTLAVAIEGRFESFFEESPLLGEAEASGDDVADDDETEAADEEEDSGPADIGTVTSVIERSPESARLIVIGSGAFVADRTIRMVGSADGTLYSNSIQLVANLVDWAVEDQALMSIRSRGHFNRTLPAMPENEQRVWEYVNYGVAVIAVLAVFGINLRQRARRRRVQAAWLEDAA